MHYSNYIFMVFLICFTIATTEKLSGNESGNDVPHKRHQKHKGAKYRLGFIDEMLDDYDKRAWPTYHRGQPTFATVSINVNSIGPINAANMQYNMDIYLRQAWVDHRLKLSDYNISTTVTMNGEDLVDKIWKPDLFFRNVKEAKFHFVTVPNMLLKISPEGDVLFSMRLTLVLSCHMAFRHYPLDTQTCHVVLGPYAQTVDQVKIMWKEKDPIVLEKSEVPEFDITEFSYGNFTRSIDTGSFSFLNVTFIFVRQNGYHIVQTYLPTFLIVMISWVSFWLNVDATPARVTLGVTTLLTLTTVASGIRTQLPPVSYVKAIDVWIGACSVMVFGALLEFTLVNYLSRKNHRHQGETQKFFGFLTRVKKLEENVKSSTDDGNDTDETNKKKFIQLNLKRARNVDKSCRIIFPLAFLTFNIAYWPYYLHA